MASIRRRRSPTRANETGTPCPGRALPHLGRLQGAAFSLVSDIRWKLGQDYWNPDTAEAARGARPVRYSHSASCCTPLALG